jgi:predicted amidohydrolase
VRVAAVQAESVSGDVDANVATGSAWIALAAAEGARLVVLPELFVPGYDPDMLAARTDVDVDPGDDRLSPLAAAAAEAGVAALAGASVRWPDGRRTLSLLSFSPAGRVDVAYSKQHLWEAEQKLFEPGASGSTLVLDSWPVGLGVCYDGCFAEHARAASDAGALAYVCPSAYLVGSEHRRDVYYAARALDNGIYTVMSGLVGRCGPLEFSGGTAVYDPQGRAIARIESGTGMAIADLDRAAVDEARRINPYDRDRPASLGGRTQLVLTQPPTRSNS